MEGGEEEERNREVGGGEKKEILEGGGEEGGTGKEVGGGESEGREGREEEGREGEEEGQECAHASQDEEPTKIEEEGGEDHSGQVGSPPQAAGEATPPNERPPKQAWGEGSPAAPSSSPVAPVGEPELAVEDIELSDPQQGPQTLPLTPPDQSPLPQVSLAWRVSEEVLQQIM